MELTTAFLAHAVQVSSEQQMYMLGGGIETLLATELPTSMRPASVLARFRFPPEECGKTHLASLKITGPSGSRYDLEMAFELRPTLPEHFLDRESHIAIGLSVSHLTFDLPGLWAFDFFGEGRRLGGFTVGIVKPN
jgi:hypothetical protein